MLGNIFGLRESKDEQFNGVEDKAKWLCWEGRESFNADET